MAMGRDPALDGKRRRPHSVRVSRLDGRPAHVPKGRRGGKSGLHGHTVPDNVRRGQPQGKCHRNQTACPASAEAGKGETVR